MDHRARIAAKLAQSVRRSRVRKGRRQELVGADV
jgi:hypothetical protein